eukprot:scaffold126970_cov63-Phaeocystis_antarctica.AAC.5
MHEDEEAAGWGWGASWQWEGRRCNSARQALMASSYSVMRELPARRALAALRSSVMRECRSDAGNSFSDRDAVSKRRPGGGGQEAASRGSITTNASTVH